MSLPRLAESQSIVQACSQNVGELSGSLGRALDGEFELRAGAPTAIDHDHLPRSLQGPGFVVLLNIGTEGLLGILSESSGLLPDWYDNPDPTGASKLSTLAQELSLLLLPDAILAENFRGWHVDDIGAMLERAGVPRAADRLPLSVTSSGRTSSFDVVWPAAMPDKVFAASEPVESTTASESNSASSGPIEPIDNLPPYTRSLLRIEVPVTVKLASTKQSIQDILDLGPGSIIKFNKPCDELLDLEVGGEAVARGEAVKVGDKFGLRITSMTLPGERFQRLGQKKFRKPA